MTRTHRLHCNSLLIAIFGALGLWTSVRPCMLGAQEEQAALPQFKVDPFWPKPLPNKWLLGEVAGVAVDARDHVWIVQRPGSLTEDELGAAQDPPISDCCLPAPPVMEFDPEGNVVQAWGGPADGYAWPEREHGIFIDHNDHVWIGGNGDNDHQVLEFTRQGRFLLQIGQAGMTGGSNHKQYLGHPADIAVDPETNEVFIADGYLNKRVIVFSAETGEYRRHWGAYGSVPDDRDPGPYDPAAPPPGQFRSPVHAVRISHDGLVYVADRVNNRIQVFQRDGTFVRETIVAGTTLGAGSTWDVELSPDGAQSLIYGADGTNQHVRVFDRHDLRHLHSVGHRGRYAGQFHWVHSMAADSRGNLYTGEVNTGRRLQKFEYQGSPQN